VLGRRFNPGYVHSRTPHKDKHLRGFFISVREGASPKSPTNLTELIATREGEERELVGRMPSERTRAAAAVVYADERAAATVAKAERHLGRELERMLHLLHGMQAARVERGERVGEVLGSVLELTPPRDGVVAALAEVRGCGPPLLLTPAAEGSQVDDAAVPGNGAAHSEPVTCGR
jgi:hypothetical protein